MKLNHVDWRTGNCWVQFRTREFNHFKINAMKFCRANEYSEEVGSRYLNHLILSTIKSIRKEDNNASV